MPAVGDFRKTIESESRRKKTRVVLALDLGHRDDTRDLLSDSLRILQSTKDYICGVKINFHLLLPLSLAEIKTLNEFALSQNLETIADIKLNDIDSTNKVAIQYLWDAGFSAVIVNPFAGYEGGLDTVLKSARESGKGVIALAYMSHKGADEGYGLKLQHGGTVFELFLDRAKLWSTDGVVLGSTRPEKIKLARARLGNEMLIFSPGSGAQGGEPSDALEAGTDYLIYGRSIVTSPDPDSAAKEICRSIAIPSKERH